MNFTIARDVFRRRGIRPSRVEADVPLGADAYVAIDRSAFVTGLRDWRRIAETSARHPAHAADGEWTPL